MPKPRGLLWGLPSAATLTTMCLCGPARTAAPQLLGRLPAGTDPDSIDFTASELDVLERGAT